MKLLPMDYFFLKIKYAASALKPKKLYSSMGESRKQKYRKFQVPVPFFFSFEEIYKMWEVG